MVSFCGQQRNLAWWSRFRGKGIVQHVDASESVQFQDTFESVERWLERPITAWQISISTLKSYQGTPDGQTVLD